MPGVTLDLELPHSLYSSFAHAQPSELRAILSNLITNSVEAMGVSGRVCVTVAHKNGGTIIRVDDNGKGIPKEVLPKLMEMGATFGKPNGMGVGLYHAQRKIEEWGGQIHIDSEEGVGTRVSITIPHVTPPAWFVPLINLSTASIVVVVDDDPSVHQVWKIRLGKFIESKNIEEMVHISSPANLRKWVKENPTKADSALFLVDYEFHGHNETGLDLIGVLPKPDRATLVTGHSDIQTIQERCAKSKISLLPKTMLPFVPIVGDKAV